jgi:small subunit ribosomal protein S6
MAITPNYYETLYVTRPDLTDEELGKIQQKLLDSISSNQGEVIRDDKWAERDLAYEIQDHKRGIYYILVFNALPEASKQIEKHLQFYNTDVLRFMTLKITEEAANKNKATQEESTPKTEPAAAPPKAEPAPTASAAEPAAESATAPASATEEGGAQ